MVIKTNRFSYYGCRFTNNSGLVRYKNPKYYYHESRKF